MKKKSMLKKKKKNKHWGTSCAFILNLVNKKGLPVWKLAYSFSVYIILPENTHQYLFTAAYSS
jgi:hypothetical protein